MCDGFFVIHPIWKCNLRARDKVFFNKNESCNAFHHCWVQFGNIPGGARCHAATAQKQLSQRQHPLQKSKNMSFAHGGHRAWQSQIGGWFIKGHLHCLKTPCLHSKVTGTSAQPKTTYLHRLCGLRETAATLGGLPAAGMEIPTLDMVHC